MAPLDRRRRRRRPLLPVLLLALAGAVVLALVVAGMVDVPRASAPYRQAVNRSYVARAGELVVRSNAQGIELGQLMGSLTTLGRDQVRHRLGSLAVATGALAGEAAALSPPDPTVSGFPEVMAARARGVAQVREAVDGLLGLDHAGRSSLGTAAAAAQLTRAGTTLERADAAYAAVRRGFRAAPGGARLPRSRWVTHPSGWTPAPVGNLVQALTATPGLAPRHRVVLVPGTVRIVPAAVPPAVHPGGPSVVLPTRTLQVDAVVANEGNVAEHGVRVTASVVPQGAGRPDTRSLTVAVVPGGSVAVSFPDLAVSPGGTYTLTVAVDPPAGQAAGSATSATYSLRIAQPTPPTTTTTTTTAPPRTTTTTAPPGTTTAHG